MTTQQDVEQSDIHTTAGKLADLARRTDEAVHAGSARAVEKQHARGKKTARERIELLLELLARLEIWRAEVAELGDEVRGRVRRVAELVAE